MKTYKYSRKDIYAHTGNVMELTDDTLVKQKLLAIQTMLLATKPEVWRPKEGTDYFIPILLKPELFVRIYWVDSEFDNEALEKGLAFRTKQEAQNAAKIMLEALKKGDTK
jgi:hypothetical protein